MGLNKQSGQEVDLTLDLALQPLLDIAQAGVGAAAVGGSGA